MNQGDQWDGTVKPDRLRVSDLVLLRLSCYEFFTCTTADDFEVYNEEAFTWEPDDAEFTDDNLSGAEDDLAEALDAQHMLDDSYVLPKSELLPLPRLSDKWLPGQMADMLACSYPSPQHDPGATAELVSLQHWSDDTGQHRCKIEAFLPVCIQPDVGLLIPNSQGIADLPSPFTTVDRAGDLVAAGSPAGDILIWRLRSDTAEGMHLVGHFSVDSAINSVRFGMWSGARRLIAACQEGMVLLLDASGREEPLTAEDMLLNGANLNMETCSVYVSLKLHQIERGDPQTTAALWPSKFFKAVGDMPSDGVLSPIPVYLATPSPNGQWMAICSVMPECVLIPSVDNKEPPIQFVISSLSAPLMHGEDMEEAEAEASWYASWNASGTFVAVASNALTRVTVYNMTTRQVVLRLWHEHRACVAVAWHPHDEHILLFAESHSAVQVVDVRFPCEYQQLLVEELSSLSIKGLCISPDSRIWVATKVGLHASQLLRHWSTDTHKHWPRLFRELVEELVLGCLAQHPHNAAAGTSQPAADIDSALLETLQCLHGLPLEVLLNIFQQMAEPIGFWRKTNPAQQLTPWPDSWPGKGPRCAEVYLRHLSVPDASYV